MVGSMGHADTVYLNMLRRVLEQGERRGDRTGVGTLSLFGHQVEYDLTKGFPLLTSKKIHFKSVVYELLWFLSGRTDAGWLEERGVKIWSDWATEEECAKFGREKGDLGPIYSKQWVNWDRVEGGTVNQVQRVLDLLRTDPNSRRMVVSAWNAADIDAVTLPACHTLFQFYVREGNLLDCHLYSRSCDVFLGCPFNVASYALLTHMMAQVVGLKPGKFVHSVGDLHLYLNHQVEANKQLQRENSLPPMPELQLNTQVTDLFSFAYEDIKLINYKPLSRIRAAVAV